MSRADRLLTVLALNVALVLGLVTVGITAHSLAVLAAGVDYLADAAAIGISLLAIWLERRPATAGRDPGSPKATTIAALVNAGWLLVLNVAVAVGACWRLLGGTPAVSGLPVLIASAIAAGVMLLGALILAKDTAEENDLNMRAVLVDTAGDGAAACGVAVSGAVILAAGRWFWLDPAVALAIALVVGYHALALLREVLAALTLPGRAA